jgi:phospholipid-transporting ATPase
VRFGNWILIFTNFVPISLLVSLEMVKFIQGILISKDDALRSIPDGEKVAVQSSNLNEELGQVEYIFSDKTGTLTCNLMEFKNLCINRSAFGKKI